MTTGEQRDSTSVALKTTVYALCNHLTGEAYIGESSQFRLRVYQHFYTLRRGTHSNIALQAAYDADGESAFGLVVLERVANPDCQGIPWRAAQEDRWTIRARAAGIVLYNDRVGRGRRRAA